MNPVLILTKNNSVMNKRCIDSAMEQDIATKIFVYDNCSTDGNAEWVARNDAIHDLSQGIDLGVSEGWNFGLNALFGDPFNAKHVLVVNNDTVLPSWFYSTLLSYDGPMITGVSVSSIAEIASPPPRKDLVPHPDMSAYLIRRECWERVGEFDADMVLYAQDLDFHLRAHRTGVRLMNCGCPFYHERSSTINYASPLEKNAIRLQADADRSVFRNKWGVPALGGPAYDAMFDESLFGIDIQDKLVKNMIEHNHL